MQNNEINIINYLNDYFANLPLEKKQFKDKMTFVYAYDNIAPETPFASVEENTNIVANTTVDYGEVRSNMGCRILIRCDSLILNYPDGEEKPVKGFVGCQHIANLIDEALKNFNIDGKPCKFAFIRVGNIAPYSSQNSQTQWEKALQYRYTMSTI